MSTAIKTDKRVFFCDGITFNAQDEVNRRRFDWGPMFRCVYTVDLRTNALRMTTANLLGG